MDDGILVKHWYGNADDMPEEINNGCIYYTIDTKDIYIDINNVRTKYTFSGSSAGASADWAEDNEENAGYIRNKPELGTASACDVVDQVDESEDVPSAKAVYDAIVDASSWIKIKGVDRWAQIAANENYATDYNIGDLVDLDLGQYGIHDMELVAFDRDEKADGTGKARMTWISKDIITLRPMNGTDSTTGAWENSGMRQWLQTDLWAILPDSLKNNIVTVTKESGITTDPFKIVTADNIWIPSYGEFVTTEIDEEDASMLYPFYYNVIFGPNQRKRAYNGVDSIFWLRDVGNATSYEYISEYGGFDDSASASSSHGVVIGFCI